MWMIIEQLYWCIDLYQWLHFQPELQTTCIDHIFVKIPIQLKQTKLLSCFIHIDLSKPKTQPRQFIRIFSEYNFQKFKHKLENIDWYELFQPDIDWYEVLIDKVQNAFYVAFPLVKISRKRS